MLELASLVGLWMAALVMAAGSGSLVIASIECSVMSVVALAYADLPHLMAYLVGCLAVWFGAVAWILVARLVRGLPLVGIWKTEKARG